jgi:hypothetical protein
MWIVAAVLGVLVIVAGVKHFGGSAPEDETAVPQRLTQREAKPEHGGWSVRSNSEELETSDDVKVQRRIEAKPGNIVPRRSNQPPESQAGQPAAGTGAAANPDQPASDIAKGDEPQAGVGGDVPGGTTVGRTAPSGTNVGRGAPSDNDNGGTANATGGMPVAAVDMNGAQLAAANTQPGTEQNPTHDQQVQPTPPEAANPVEMIGAIYDSKDATFSTDTPVEVKDIGNLPGPGVTMKMQLTTDLPADNQDDATFLKLGDNLELSKNVNFMRLEYFDSAGKPYGIGSDMTTWAAQGIEQPYDVTVAVVGNHLSMIVNNKGVAQGTVDGPPFELQSNPALHVGCVDFAPGRPCASSALSNVKVR